MATFKDAAKSIRQAAKNVPANANIIVRKVSLAIDQALVFGTPVLTGRARANWQVSIGQPVTTSVSFAPSGKAVDSIGLGSEAGDFSVQAAIAATKGYSGGSIWIVNNLPYIIPLNNGHSQQADPGWVENAILNGVKAVRSVKLLEPPTADKE